MLNLPPLNTELASPDDLRRLVAASDTQGVAVESFRSFLADEFQLVRIKQNPLRRVFRLTSHSGRTLYFKLFIKISFPASCFRFYPRMEYAVSHRWNTSGIPVIDYLAWGRFPGGGFTVSEGVPLACTALKYFFCRALPDTSECPVFLDKLTGLIALMFRQRCLHPDFHLCNILVNGDDLSLILADPFGMRRVFFPSDKFKLALLVPWREFRGYLPDSLLADRIVESELASTREEALNMLEHASLIYRKIRTSHRDKIIRQISSGISKYTRDLDTENGKLSIRHTPWFSFPEKTEISPQWEAVSYPDASSSEAAWLDAILYNADIYRAPVARLVRSDGTSVLYFTNYAQYGIR